MNKQFRLACTENKTTVRTGLFGMFSHEESACHGHLIDNEQYDEMKNVNPQLYLAVFGSADLFEIGQAFALRAGSRYKVKGFSLTTTTDDEAEFFPATYLREIEELRVSNERNFMTREYKRISGVLFEDMVSGNLIGLDNELSASIIFYDDSSDDIVKDFNNLFLEIWKNFLDNHDFAAELDELFYAALEKSRIENERYHNSF